MDDVLRNSVTRGDASDGVLHWIFPSWTGRSSAPLHPVPPAYWSHQRDAVLRSTVFFETMWANAISIAISKMSALQWEVSGDVPLRVRQSQELFHTVQGGHGWVGFLSRHLRDYLCCDNGAFIEVVRASSARGSRMLGLMHLDSLRCRRTGDPDIPVIYRDRKGNEHEMKEHQVVMLSDLPDPSDMLFGIGLCATSRAYAAIAKMTIIESYLQEKVSGSKPLAVHLVNGVSERQLLSALTTADEEQNRKGAVVYKGVVVVPMMGDVPPQVATIPLAEIPDGFDSAQERRDAQLKYAKAIGLDPQDLNPDLLASRAMGTGAQSGIIDDKAKWQGLASWQQGFMHAMNQWILPSSVIFAFVDRDYRDMQARSDISRQRADTVGVLVDRAIISADQARQVLIDQDELPKEFVVVDETPDETLSDNEKPTEAAAKERASDAAFLLADELDAAVLLFEAVMNEMEKATTKDCQIGKDDLDIDG